MTENTTSCGNKDSQKRKGRRSSVCYNHQPTFCLHLWALYCICIFIYIRVYIYMYTHFLFCFPAHLSKNSDPPWFEKLGCVCLKPNISLFDLKVCCVKVQTASMLPGFFQSPWQSKVLSPQSQVELHLWGNLRYQKKSSRKKKKGLRFKSSVISIWNMWPHQVFKRIHWNTWTNYYNSKTWVNGIFGGDSLTITT